MSITYDIEIVPAILTPFDWSASTNVTPNTTTTQISSSPASGYASSATNAQISISDQQQIDYLATSSGLPVGYYSNSNVATAPSGSYQGNSGIPAPGTPLYPLTLTGGLVFPYSPTISESIGVKYDVTELVHANENIHTYKNTDNVRITLSDCIWTSETFDQAVYTLGVIHFFRSYRLMDFGRSNSGRPPSPMWFSAYGAFMYNAVPVLLERVEMPFTPDVDYVGVPNPNTAAYTNQTLTYSTNMPGNVLSNVLSQTGDYTWIPIKFVIPSISMVVQNSIYYWTQEFSLAAFKAGALVGIR